MSLKFVPIIIFMFFSGITVFSQSYYALKNRGVGEEYNMSAPNGSAILTQPSDDQYSEVQEIPFEWFFYGEEVTHFKASDNGFITFDINEEENNGSNDVIPSSTGPNNAIYAFWDDIELSNNPDFVKNDIKTYTIGSEPDRVFVIQWHVTPKGKTGNSNYLFFAIRLFEQGDFDILYQQIRLSSSAVTATAGCENKDGSEAYMIDGSPDFSYTGGTYLPENCLVYSFFNSEQPENDIKLDKLIIKEVAGINESIDISGKIINHGTANVNSMKIRYQVDDGEEFDAVLEGLDIPLNEEYTFTHPVKWQPTKAGEFQTVKCSIIEINSSEDANSDGNELSYDVFVNNGYTADKKVLVETFSTAQCGFCPEGHLYLQEILDNHTHIFGFTHHSGFGKDSMTISASTGIASEFTNGAPTAVVDRVLWPGNIRHAIGRYNNIQEKKNYWEMKAMERLMENAPLGLDLEALYSNDDQEMTITANVEVIDYIKPGDLRLNIFIIEDNVSKEGPGYDQKNYYNTTAGHHYYGKGDPIVGYNHRHVIRASLTGTWGESGLLDQAPVPGQSVTKTYSYNVPDTFKFEDLRVIGFVSYYEGSKYRIILNAEETEPVTVNIADEIADNIMMYPNPVDDYLIIKSSFENYNIRIINSLGQIYLNKGYQQDGMVDLAFLGPGLYLLHLEYQNTIYVRKIIKL